MEHDLNFAPYLSDDLLTEEGISLVREHVRARAAPFYRDFAWRRTDDPYAILVSEIMLQQTQVQRVRDKYEEFLGRFPDFKTLAAASLRDVLATWSGLGYNRRGAALHAVAHSIVTHHQGVLPNDPEILVQLPGIGPNTAGSLCAFSFQRPTVFIETNIRTVFIHLFFRDSTDVHDRTLIPLIAQTVDPQDPRRWYYALMDYGVVLKKQFPNPSRRSIHHTKQSKFEGSARQLSGAIVRHLARHECVSYQDLAVLAGVHDERLHTVLERLMREQLVHKRDGFFLIASSGV